MKNFIRRGSHGHHGSKRRKLAQHAHSRDKGRSCGQLTVEIHHKFNSLVVCKAGCDVEVVESHMFVIKVVEVKDEEFVGLFKGHVFNVETCATEQT